MALAQEDVPIDPARRLREILDSFARTTGVRGVALADRKGLPIASSFRARVDVNLASAMAALAVQVSSEVFKNFGFTSFRCSIMEGESATVLACLLHGGQMSIIAVLEDSANLGLVKMTMNKVEGDILGVFDQGRSSD